MSGFTFSNSPNYAVDPNNTNKLALKEVDASFAEIPERGVLFVLNDNGVQRLIFKRETGQQIDISNPSGMGELTDNHILVGDSNNTPSEQSINDFKLSLNIPENFNILNNLKLNNSTQQTNEIGKGILQCVLDDSNNQQLIFVKEDNEVLNLTKLELAENNFFVGGASGEATEKTPLQVREILNVQEFVEDREINSVLNNFMPNTTVVDINDTDTILTAIQKIAAWKNVISGNSTKSLTGLIPTMDISGEAGGFKVSASSYSPNYANPSIYHWFHMFDNDNTTQWVANGEANPTIYVDFPEQKRIWKMSFQGRTNTDEIFRNVNLYGSNDKTNWYLIATERDINRRNFEYETLVDSSDAYQYVKLDTIDTNGGNVGLRKFQLYEIT